MNNALLRHAPTFGAAPQGEGGRSPSNALACPLSFERAHSHARPHSARGCPPPSAPRPRPLLLARSRRATSHPRAAAQDAQAPSAARTADACARAGPLGAAPPRQWSRGSLPPPPPPPPPRPRDSRRPMRRPQPRAQPRALATRAMRTQWARREAAAAKRATAGASAALRAPLLCEDSLQAPPASHADRRAPTPPRRRRCASYGRRRLHEEKREQKNR